MEPHWKRQRPVTIDPPQVWVGVAILVLNLWIWAPYIFLAVLLWRVLTGDPTATSRP